MLSTLASADPHIVETLTIRLIVVVCNCVPPTPTRELLAQPPYLPLPGDLDLELPPFDWEVRAPPSSGLLWRLSTDWAGPRRGPRQDVGVALPEKRAVADSRRHRRFLLGERQGPRASRKDTEGERGRS